ncbi:MAG: NAD-dependent epimerase/dehydratase family protein, partial [Chloroflexota bacterium]
MRVVVTGAAGTLGRSLVPKLSADGHNVVGLDVVAGAGAEWVVADIRERAAVLDAVEGA